MTNKFGVLLIQHVQGFFGNKKYDQQYIYNSSINANKKKIPINMRYNADYTDIILISVYIKIQLQCKR